MRVPRPSRLPRRPRIATAMACVAVTLSLTTCSSTTETATPGGGGGGSSTTVTVPQTERDAGPPRSGGQLNIGLTAETNSFNPYKGQWALSSYVVANAVMEPLMALDPAGIAHPYLAEAIITSGDFKEWVITLRPGVEFHNGEVLDATALKLNLDTARTAGLTSQAYLAVQSVDVVDPLKVSVKMSKPWTTFPASLVKQAGYMAAPAMLADTSNDVWPVGTGPFQVEDRIRDANLKVKRFAKYRGKDANGVQLPYLDSIEFKIVPDSTTRYNALRSGDLDAMDVTVPDSYQTVTEAARKHELQALTDDKTETDETVIALNTSREPFDDPIARQAIAYGIDQNRVSEDAYQNAFPPAWSMFSDDSPYYISKQEAGYPEPDVAKARSLVEEYERKHGKPLEFTVLIPAETQYLQIAQKVQEYATEFGVKISIQTVEQTVLIQRVIATGDYEAAGFLLWSSPTPDQSAIFLATKAVPTGLSLNFTRFDDAEIVSAMDDYRSAAQPQDRIDTMKRVQRSLAKNLQLVFLVHNRAAFAYGNSVHGFRAATFEGTDVKAYAPYPASPFATFAWKDEA